MDARPLKVIEQNEETQAFELDEEALASVLLSPEVADKYVCVLAVAGAFRKGKSFLLDFLLQYCESGDYQSSGDWLADTKRPLEGFKWSQGFQRETTGILMWSKPFIMRTEYGEQVAVILLDTQGTFDTESSVKESTLIFALTLLVSSVLVYNLMNNIQEDDLMNLQTFASFGTLAQEKTGISNAFQKLVFLVRDWGFSSVKPYGSEGGQDVLDTILEIKEKQHPTHQDVRRDLRRCFEDLSCYLMPHPGFKALEKKGFDGRLADLEENFVEHLRLLVPQLLAPESLLKKKFNGQPIRAKELFEFFKTSVEMLKDMEELEPTTFVEFTARINSQRAQESSKEIYRMKMDALVREQAASIIDKLEEEHERVKQEACEAFLEDNECDRNNRRVIEEYKEKLENEVDQLFRSFFAPLASSKAALEAGKKSYEKALDQILAKSALKADKFKKVHKEEMQRAVDMYKKYNAYGGENLEIFEDFLAQLEKIIEELYSKYERINAAQLEKEKKAKIIAAASTAAGAAAAAAIAGIVALAKR